MSFFATLNTALLALALPLTLGAQTNVPAVQETRLTNIRQLTHGGDNAEAYWSSDGKSLCFQSNNKAWGLECDQIFDMPVKKAAKTKGFKPRMVSTGKGRTTCAFYMPDNKHILYASTHGAADPCPPTADLRQGGKYLWPVYSTYDIFVADKKGRIVRQLTNAPGYDAEAVVSPKGDKIVFTSDRSGDLELWTMDIDGSNQRQVTHGLGYDGGAFFSPDGQKLVFRASRPQTEADIKEYKDFLAKGLVAPSAMEIFTCNVDGSDLQQVTRLGKANWAPYYHPSGKKIIFSSNHHSSRGYDFQLYMVNTDGSGLEQITHESIFNAFAMFSPDGKQIVWCSNRNNNGTHDTNVFVADWKE